MLKDCCLPNVIQVKTRHSQARHASTSAWHTSPRCPCSTRIYEAILSYLRAQAACYGTKSARTCLLVCIGVAPVSKQVARHDGAAVSDAALVQLRQLQWGRWRGLEGALYLSAGQKCLQQKDCMSGGLMASRQG